MNMMPFCDNIKAKVMKKADTPCIIFVYFCIYVHECP